MAGKFGMEQCGMGGWPLCSEGEDPQQVVMSGGFQRHRRPCC